MAFAYQDNTWYRLVVQADAGQNIRLSLNNDAGVELIGRTLSHGALVYASGFELVLSQAMGLPTSPRPVDVAVDFARLSIPEPNSAALLVLGGIVCWVRGRKGIQQG